MFIEFYYPEINGVEIPDNNFRGVFKPKNVESTVNIEALIRTALQNPLGSETLNKRVKSSDNILLLSDDNTRSTPVKELLSVILPDLQSLGIRKEKITILMALGTHRVMTRDELIDKLGPRVVDEYQVINHLWDKKEQNKFYGKTSRGIEVWGNKLLQENDFVIGLGHIVPHRVAGFSGGGKIVQPGAANGKSTGETHWLSALVKGSDLIGRRDNPVREQIDEAAQLMGLDFIVNVVQDLNRKTVGVFAGDLVDAHRAGCRMAKEIYGVKIPQADIVITDSYPADLELWQAAKGIYSSDLVVKDGGYIILVTPCPDGVAKAHPEIERFGYQSLEKTQQLLTQGKLQEKSVAAHLVHSGQVIREKARGILVCPHISDSLKEKLGFIPAESVQAALTYALSKLGKGASVVVLLHAGEILPLIDEEHR